MAAQGSLPAYLPESVLTWATDSGAALELVAARFIVEGEWPAIGRLTRDLARRGSAVPLGTILDSLPRWLGFKHGHPPRVVLLLFGLRLTEQGRPLLDGFISALRLAVTRYQSSDDNPKITRQDLLPVGATEESLARALSEILLREAPFLGSGTGGPSDVWVRDITDDVVRYWNALSIDDYLRIRADELRGLLGAGLSEAQLSTRTRRLDRSATPSYGG